MIIKALSPRAFFSTALLVCFVGAASAAPKDPVPAKGTPAPAKTVASSTADKAPEAVLYVPGAYQDWKPATAPQIASVAGSPKRFDGYVNFVGAGEQPFKFTDAPDWVHTNYGNGNNGTFSTDGQAGGLSVPGGGYYELTADLAKNTWTATKTTWSVIGDATPGGWEKDTPLVFNPDKQVWTATMPMKVAGSFKFRANDAWKIDFGLDTNGKLQYVDNPFFDYAPTLKNLTVPDNGTYTITLDLHVPGKYTYSLEVK